MVLESDKQLLKRCDCLAIGRIISGSFLVLNVTNDLVRLMIWLIIGSIGLNETVEFHLIRGG